MYYNIICGGGRDTAESDAFSARRTFWEILGYSCEPRPKKVSGLRAYKLVSYPYSLSFVYSGNYNWVNGTVENQGVNGNWWSSTALSRTNAYNLNINYNPRLIPQNNNVRAYGFSVRCVSK